jgi:hypothetical protein
MFQTNMAPQSSRLKCKLRRKTAYYLLDAGFLLGLSFSPEHREVACSSKCQLTLIGMHDTISQETELFDSEIA